jgi:hypothetical protein
MEDAMSDPCGFRALIRGFLNKQSEAYRAEISAGVDAEREEEIKAWFLPPEAMKRFRELHDKREARETKHRSLSELPRPDLLNRSR